MKLNNKGFALTSIIYMLIVLFLMILLLILANLAQRKAVLDKIKNDIKTNLNQGITINTSELPYLNITTGIYYETLEETFNNVQEGTESTIKVLKNIEDVSTPNLASGKNITLDLNGFKVTMHKTITNNGNLTVTGSGELTSSSGSNITNTVTGIFTKEGTSTISNTDTSSFYVINNQGLATLSEGIISAEYRAINNQSNGRLVISGADISATDMAIYNTGKASTASEPSILISDGTITSSLKQGIQNASTGMVYMSGGIVTSNGANLYGIQNNSSGGTVIVTGGTINAAYRCIRNSTNSTLIIEGGTFSAVGVRENTYSTQALSLAGGTINISGGNFNVNKGSSSASSIVELENNTTPNVTITGGTFTGDGGGIAVNGAGTLEIDGTTSITAVANGINNVRTGTVNIKSGTITSTSGIGVKNSNASGTITIGLDDSDVSTTSPIITGKTYGVQNQAGTVNFYDGKIVGQSGNESAISGTVNTPSEYGVVKSLDGTTETATLGQLHTITYDYNYMDNDIFGTKLVTNNFYAATSTGTTSKVDNNIAKYGKEARWTATSNDTTGGPHISPGRLTVGNTYTWSVYVKASKNMTLNIGSEQNGRKAVNVTTEWKRVTHTFVAGDTTHNSFTFYAINGKSVWNTGDILYVHSLELKETPTLNITTDTKPSGAQLGTLPAPTRTGYTFDGWYTAPVGGTKITSTTLVPNADTTYYARWIYSS